MQIVTDRLLIRPAAFEDIHRIVELWNDPRITTFVGFPFGLRTNADIVASQLVPPPEHLTDRILVVIHYESGKIIGQAMMHSPDQNGLSTTDIKLNPDHQGLHYGSEIKRALLTYLFHETSCTIVETTPNLANSASIHLQESCGAIRIGRGRWEPSHDSSADCIPVDYWIYRVYKHSAPYPDVRHRQFQYTAIIPVAGKSQRMRQFKPLLPWPPNQQNASRCVIQSAISSLMEAGIDPIRVAVGTRGTEIKGRLKNWPVQIVEGASGTKAMSDTIVKVLPLIDPASVIVILPGDHPAVAPETIRRLVGFHEENPDRIHIPSFGGKSGHPAFFPPSANQFMACSNRKNGLRSVIHDSSLDVVYHEMGDPGILKNLDLPSDYSV
ncbi:GNAT family N-acetyltransferase [bacterium]|nr:GNAT family N-acetyltransferase [candidate division CSSED10-310 bacterium]